MRLAAALSFCVSLCLYAGGAVAADLPEPVQQKNPMVHVWTGFSYAPGSIYGYVGGVFPLNGDLYVDGIQFRAEGGLGRFDYDGGGIYDDLEIDQRAFDAMVGYHWNWGSNSLSAFAGLNYQDVDNPDPNAAVRGDEFGFKVQGEIYSPFNDKLYGYALANYSTAFNTYYGSAKTLYRSTDRFAFGPEVTALGNDGFDQIRLGGTAAIGVFEFGQAIFGVGHAWTDGDGRNGIYANIHLRAAF